MYLCLLKRLRDLKITMKNEKVERSMLGSFRVFLKSCDDENLSDEEILKHYESIDPLFACFSLENSGEPTDTPNLDKPIVARDYTLIWTDTSCTVPKEYQNKLCNNLRHEVLQLLNPKDESFKDRKILMHVGNTAHDTLGCILLGMQADDTMIYKSTEAIKRFFDLVKEYGAENFKLKIIDKD
ncbi:DUF5675 family protein [Helicobacter cetorum]|uniref:DUF5675 family protein n=1 Tax=Helicobacter cetorum TaxID=138563 RepID=UPI000CF0567A|nr:DUF5675 family protein [Helicobacter cetorum]